MHVEAAFAITEAAKRASPDEMRGFIQDGILDLIALCCEMEDETVIVQTILALDSLANAAIQSGQGNEFLESLKQLSIIETIQNMHRKKSKIE